MNAPQANFAMTVDDAERMLEWYRAACQHITTAPGPKTTELAHRLRVWRDRHQVGVDGD